MTKLPALLSLSLPLSLSMMAGAVRAQASEPGQAPPARVEVVGSADKYDARREDTTTKIVVTQEELRKYGDSTIADVLKRQPGITVSGGIGGRGGEIRMRGLGNGYTQILLNGEAAPGGFSVESLAPELVERIEILRAATAELSARSIAGTINIILKRKVQAAQRELTVRAEHSNVFFSPDAMLQLSDKADAMSYTMGVELRSGRFEQDYTQVDEGWDGAGRRSLRRSVARQNDGSFRMLTLSPRLNWLLDNGDALKLQTLVRVQRSHARTEGVWDAALGGPPGYPLERTRPEDWNDGLRADLNWTHALGEGRKLEATAGVTADRSHSRLREAGFDGSAEANPRPALEREVHDDTDSRGATLKGKYSVAHDKGHALSLGWDAARRVIDAGREQLERDGLDAAPLAGSRDDRARLDRLALYAQDEWALTPRLSAYLGLRWETLRTRAEGRDFDTVIHSASVLSPILQGVWKLPGSKQDQLRLALARTWRGDDPERLVPRVLRSLNNSAVTPDRRGNPQLDPELAWGLDAAFEHNGSKGEQLSVSVYARRIQDIIHDDTFLVGERWLTMPVNDGSASTRGIEFDAKSPLRALWAGAPDADLRMNASRNWSRVSNVPGPDNRLAGQVPLSANAGFDVRLNAAISGGMSFTWRSGGPQRISQTTSTYSTVKRELELYALWKLTPKMQVRVTGVNLLAEPATEVRRYEDGVGSQRATIVYPFSAILRVALEMKL
jgi:outer membrane receptor for ferrienterochelin and colicins